MRIEITKRADGTGVLRCTRDDSSVTWQKQREGHATFFAFHDLTHYAVETTLGYKRGFFGLLSEGWDISDTDGKGSRGPLPREAMEAEYIVGLLSAEQASGASWTIEEFQEFGSNVAHRLTPDTIGAIKRRREELFQKWSSVPAGGTLELAF